MIYQLPNGKVINISVEAYLKMSDEDLRYLNESNFGSDIDDTMDLNNTEETIEVLFIVETDVEDIPDELDLPDTFDEEE